MSPSFFCRCASLWLLILAGILQPCQSNNCSDHTCGSLKIPYPFTSCSNSNYSHDLQCLNSTLSLKLNNSGTYNVISFTSNSVIIDPFISCNTSNAKSFDFSRIDSRYALSFKNFLIFYQCKSNSTSCPNNCDFGGTMANFTRNLKHGSCGSIGCCYDMHYAATSVLRSMDLSVTNCSVFTSWVTSLSTETNSDSVITVEAQYGLELMWSLPGNCSRSSCKANSDCCDDPHILSGHVCKCKEGYDGDPYLVGCSQVKCNATHTSGCRKRKHTSLVTFSGIVAGATVLSGLFIAFALLRRRRLHRYERRSAEDMKHLEKMLSGNGVQNSTMIFTYKELEKATRCFAHAQVLGHGGHGTVYAGRLPDGRDVAVKRLNHGSAQGVDQVINEVMVLLTVDHSNLVRLLGCCLEVRDPLLVYEYVPNGTLSEHLQRERGIGLDWYTRVTIAKEAAQGLAYLHSTKIPPIYHRDVKSTNILLDYEFNTKVADFGLSKLVLTEASHISTAPQGTPGYLDPDYHQSFQLSDKSDVYSFGVVLVEIITAMKVVDFSRDKREVNLAALAVAKITNNTFDDIIDPFLEADRNEMTRCMVKRVAELAFRCLSFDKDARPSMVEVVEELDHIRSLCTSPGDNSPIRDLKIDKDYILPR